MSIEAFVSRSTVWFGARSPLQGRFLAMRIERHFWKVRAPQSGAGFLDTVATDWPDHVLLDAVAGGTWEFLPMLERDGRLLTRWPSVGRP